MIHPKTKINLNDFVYVKLTQLGHDIHRKQHDALVDDISRRTGHEPDLKYLPVDEDDQGLSKWQLWDLMKTFGQHVEFGQELPFAPNIFIKADLP